VRVRGISIAVAGIIWAGALAVSGSVAIPAAQEPTRATPDPAAPLFDTSHNCMACHNGLTTSSGEDISFGTAWRVTMMANAVRDPYWQAAVRREVMDHPAAQAAIEAECSVCHMPMARTQAVAMGRRGEIFAHLPVGAAASPDAALAADGVSCTACHQIASGGFMMAQKVAGGFVIPTTTPPGGRHIYGPYAVTEGLAGVMRSATGFVPAESSYIRAAAICGTCHTLYTHALGPNGEDLGRFPEQVPYLEWRHSAWHHERSCQDCHMAVIREPVRISSVLGEPREGARRHSFRGGNFLMLGLLNRYRAELGVEALPQELDAAVRETLTHLATESATLTIERAERDAERLVVDLAVRNLSGHKLPTAYPSRRAWIHLVVRDAAGAIVFESGALMPDGSIRGNANDEDGSRFEPHYREIRRADEVQIYEPIMGDSAGAVTTGLLKAVRYLKDNRLLPQGFDKTTAPADAAVHGDARDDPDFTAGGDRIRYTIDAGDAAGPLVVEAVLRFQPIAFRWAKNLEAYDAPEPQRFTRSYRTMAPGSSAVLATARAEIRP
jgi:hypothetical protein